MLPTEAEARDFFSRLETYSSELVKRLYPRLHAHLPCRNRHASWRGEGPVGHVLHHTGGPRFGSVVRHFLTGGSASAHWLVASALDERLDDLRRDLDLDRDLRAEVLQFVPPWHPAWHAGWTNRFCLGTELRHAGMLRPVRRGRRLHPLEVARREDFLAPADADPEDFEFHWWSDKWTAQMTGGVDRVQAVRTSRGTFFWERHTRDALATSVVLLRYARALYPELCREWFVGHHQVKSTKVDLVLPADLVANVRESAFLDAHVDDLDWLGEYGEVAEDFGDDGDDQWLLSDLGRLQGDRGEDDLDDFDPRRIVGEVDTPAETIEALSRLGYYVTERRNLAVAVRAYQRSRGLAVDGVAGSRTNRALSLELDSWGLL